MFRAESSLGLIELNDHLYDFMGVLNCLFREMPDSPKQSSIHGNRFSETFVQPADIRTHLASDDPACSRRSIGPATDDASKPLLARLNSFAELIKFERQSILPIRHLNAE